MQLVSKLDLGLAVAWLALGLSYAADGRPWVGVAFAVLAAASILSAFSQRAHDWLHATPWRRWRRESGRRQQPAE